MEARAFFTWQTEIRLGCVAQSALDKVMPSYAGVLCNVGWVSRTFRLCVVFMRRLSGLAGGQGLPFSHKLCWRARHILNLVCPSGLLKLKAEWSRRVRQGVAEMAAVGGRLSP